MEVLYPGSANKQVGWLLTSNWVGLYFTYNMTENKSLAQVNKQISAELNDPAIVRSLLATTFKGLDEQTMRRAIFEGILRGFSFKDFLQKNIYSIPFKDGYSLITSIDYARKIGARSGVVGKNAPVYEMDGKNIISCTVTVKKRIGEYIGDFTATVYFDEFDTGRNLWTSKPRTMIAKVAEMHALRMACPEELSQAYTEEEMEAESGSPEPKMKPYIVARVVPADDDDSQGHRTHEAPVSLKTDASYVKKLVPPEGDTPTITPDPKEQKMEIARLLKEKGNFVALGKSQEKIAEKVMNMTGVQYVEDNYAAIIIDLESL